MKYLKLLFIAFIFIGCSSNDDNNNDNQTNDHIIGKWRFLEKHYEYSDTPESNWILEADDCDNISSFEYLEDYSIYVLSYQEGIDGCELEEADFEYRTWTNLGNSIYQFKSKKVGEDEHISEKHIDFQTNAMIWTETSGTVTSTTYFYRI